MRRQTKYTSITPTVYKHVYDRDNGACVLCGRSDMLQCADYIPRSHGGLGREKNLVMLCEYHHRQYDQSEHRKGIRAELREYLQSMYQDWDETELVYRKGME